VPAKHCGSEELLRLERRQTPGIKDSGRNGAVKAGLSSVQEHEEVSLLGSLEVSNSSRDRPGSCLFLLGASPLMGLIFGGLPIISWRYFLVRHSSLNPFGTGF